MAWEGYWQACLRAGQLGTRPETLRSLVRQMTGRSLALQDYLEESFAVNLVRASRAQGRPVGTVGCELLRWYLEPGLQDVAWQALWWALVAYLG